MQQALQLFELQLLRIERVLSTDALSTDTQTVILEFVSHWQQPSDSALPTIDLVPAVLKHSTVDRDNVLQQQGVNRRTAVYHPTGCM